MLKLNPADGGRLANRRHNKAVCGIFSLILTSMLMSSCAGLGGVAGRGAPPPVFPSAPLSVPAADVFGTAISDVCFEAIATGQYPEERIKDTLFSPAPSVKQSLKSIPSDRLYAASFASAPVVLSLPRAEDRCDVIAVRGDRDALKRAAEEVISRRRNLLEMHRVDYLITLDESPHKGYVLKFSLFAVTEGEAAGASLREGR